MAVTIKETESLPTSWPEFSGNLTLALRPGEGDWIWQRIEAYVSERWTPRLVTWLAEGPGDWVPPLSPATITTAQVWAGGQWSAVILSAAPDGYCLAAEGPYRITATVGGGVPPPAVEQAFRRIAEYLTFARHPNDPTAPLSATQQSWTGEGDFNGYTGGTIQRPAAWVAKAMINSGAADLLRPYRRAS